MISYSLKCCNGHRFESWFQSAAAFDTLQKGGHLTCPECGTPQVEKAIMAPAVTASRKKAALPDAPMPAPPPPSPPAMAAAAAGMPAEVKEALRKFKAHVEANSDYVGGNFASEARSMHLGDTEERPIYGEANAEEAKSLLEDGVPVLPLPFTPTKKAN